MEESSKPVPEEDQALESGKTLPLCRVCANAGPVCISSLMHARGSTFWTGLGPAVCVMVVLVIVVSVIVVVLIVVEVVIPVASRWHELGNYFLVLSRFLQRSAAQILCRRCTMEPAGF